MISESLAERSASLAQGRGSVELFDPHVTHVTGADATRWLGDLVTTGVASMEPGEARRSFLLQPNGRIRAEFFVIRPMELDGYLLLQDAAPPKEVATILGVYQLTSEVELESVSTSVFFLPSAPDLPTVEKAWQARCTDGSLPVGGESPCWIVGVPSDADGDADAFRAALDPPSGEPTSIADLRAAAGLAAFPADLGVESSPLEASEQLGDAIDHAKGCYLGQETIAKTRLRGRTPFVIRAYTSADAVARDEVVRSSDGADVGLVTSTVETGAGSLVLARVRAASVDQELMAKSGAVLTPR